MSWLRRVWEFAGQAEDRAVPSAAARAADAAFAAAVTIIAVVTVIEQARTAVSIVVFPVGPGAVPLKLHPQPQAFPSPEILLRTVLTTAPLAFRRSYPITTFCVILGAVIVTSGQTTWITFAAAIFAAYSAVAYSAYRRLALISVLAGAFLVTAAYPNTTPQVPDRFTALLVLLPTMAVGLAIRAWRSRAGSRPSGCAGPKPEHEAETRRAVEQERARIASEMHDVVTHNVSVMVVQAGAARRVLDSSPGRRPAGAAGRGGQRPDRHGRAAAPAGPAGPSGDAAPEASGAARRRGDAVLSPQPGVARSRLAGRPRLRRRAAGRADRRRRPDPAALPPGMDLAAYRVVQEALTNVMKHAGPARTTVRLEYRRGTCSSTVADDGRRACPAAAGHRRAMLGPRAGRPRADRAAGTDRRLRRRAGRRAPSRRRVAADGQDPAGPAPGRAGRPAAVPGGVDVSIGGRAAAGGRRG